MPKRPVVRLDDSGLVLDFPYDRQQVDEVKSISGARWNRVDRVWQCPLTSIDAVRRFAARHEFDFDSELLALESPPQRVPSGDITNIGSGWSVSFAYDPVAIKLFKSRVPGVRWDKKERWWKVPPGTEPELLAWAERTKRTIPQELRDVAAEVQREFNVRSEMSTAMTSTLEVNVALPLRGYQLAGVEYALRTRRCFIGDEMGTGKTYQSLAAIEHANAYPAVVVCPASLTLNWAKEVERFLPWRTVEVLKGEMPYPYSDADVLVVSWAVVKNWEPKLKPRAMVADESHYAKSLSQRTKAVRKLAKRIPQDGLVLLLTGTPISSRPAEFITQLDILGQLPLFGGTTEFQDRYCAAFEDRWGRRNVSGSSNTIELHERLRGRCYIRRTKEQVMKELPEVVLTQFYVEPDPKVFAKYQKVYDELAKPSKVWAQRLAKEMNLHFESPAVQKRVRSERGKAIVELRKLASQSKFKAVDEWVTSRFEGGHKVILAAHHRDIVDELATRYGGLKIQGGMKVEDIEEAKRKFQELPHDLAPVIVLSIDAAKTGHTLTAAQDVAFVELPWTPGDVDQTIARAHRLGQEGSVQATFFLAEGTVDIDVFQVIQDKREVVDAAVDGKRPEDAMLALFDSGFGREKAAL